MTSFRWDRSARAVLGDALARLGPVRCVAEVRPGEVVLAELPPGRRAGGLLDCGAVLSTVCAVLRVLGREPRIRFPADPDRPDVVAVVQAGEPRAPADAEWARYTALRELAQPPASSGLRPVSLAVLRALSTDGHWPGTTVHIVRPEWTPTLRQLGADLAGRSSLLVTTPGDSRSEHVLAGAALHGTRLAAAVRGLVSRVVLMPVQAPAERARYVEQALLPGLPQALLLVGQPTPHRRTP